MITPHFNVLKQSRWQGQAVECNNQTCSNCSILVYRMCLDYINTNSISMANRSVNKIAETEKQCGKTILF